MKSLYDLDESSVSMGIYANSKDVDSLAAKPFFFSFLPQARDVLNRGGGALGLGGTPQGFGAGGVVYS